MERNLFALIAMFLACSSLSLASTQYSDVAPDKRLVPSRDLLRYFLFHYPNHELSSFRSQLSGIPYRPVRRLGSEFLGKRSGSAVKRSLLGSEFLGKRARGPFEERGPLDLYPKRGAMIGSEFLGKRDDSSKDKRDKESPENLVIGAYASDEESD